MFGVYCIENIINSKIYIGSCANKYGFKARFRQHRHELRKNKHFNRHLQASWNKYGESCFKFTVLEYTGRDAAVDREQYYIDTLNPEYNISKIAGSTLGLKLSAQACKNIGNSKRGVKYTQDQIQSKCKKIKDQYGTVYPSISAAARAIGSHLSCVQNVLKGKHSHALGYKFYFLDERILSDET